MSRLAALALSTLVGCGGPSGAPPAHATSTDAPAPPSSEGSTDALARALEAAIAEPLSGLVTMDAAARIAPAPTASPDGLGWRAWLAEGERSGRVVSVLVDRGDAIRVATLARQPCAEPYADASFYRLEGWIARAALLPIISDDAVRLHEDGSGVLVRAGRVPVLHDGAMHVGEEGLDVPVAAEQLAFSVAPDAPMGSLLDGLGGSWRDLDGQPSGDASWRCDSFAFGGGEDAASCRERLRDEARAGLTVGRFVARVGGRAVLTRTCEHGLCEDRGPLAHRYFEEGYGREEGGARHIVLAGRCLQVAAVVDVLPRYGGGLGGLGGMRGTRACYSVAAGTPLEWEDGSLAGAITSAVELSAERPRTEPRTCSRALAREAAAPVCIGTEHLRDGTCITPESW